MTFLPWQQSARGNGRVVAYVPQERQQTVTSPVKGVVERLAEGLVEGSRFKQGDFILEIEPGAANLEQQLQAQMRDLQTKMQTANTKAEVYSQNVKDFGSARDFAVSAADEMVQAAQAKLEAKKQLIPGYVAKENQARLNYTRQKSLFEKGLKPEKEIEVLKEDWDVAVADLESARQEVTAAEQEWEAKKHEREQKLHESQTKVDYARAMYEDAVGQAATQQKEIRDLEIKQSELDRLEILAPRDGVIYRTTVFERGQSIKEGDPLFTIVPDASDRAVELWVSGNDTPLIQLGDHVRLQFEGWPAVQFAGWPSVAVGTFGGEVAAIDATDDGTGKFRVLVRPGVNGSWPSQHFLRQGVRSNGWVMLDRVRLGYEIWRQLNGFPPVRAKHPAATDEKGEKTKVPLPK
jgi:multidrug resistance efflux pump